MWNCQVRSQGLSRPSEAGQAEKQVRECINCKLITFIIFITSIRGELLTVQKGKVCASAWQDRKTVMVMSTNCQATETGSVQQKTQDGSRISVPCPQAVLQYNTYMGGVDRGDQLRGYYKCRSRSRKFYKYIFTFCLDVAITNAFILMKNFGHDQSRLIMKDFRLQLASQLIGDYCSRRRPGRRSTVMRTLPLRHFPIKITLDNPAKKKRGRCANCHKTKHSRMDTSWFCRECCVWLCHSGDTSSDCFLQWHTHTE